MAKVMSEGESRPATVSREEIGAERLRWLLKRCGRPGARPAGGREAVPVLPLVRGGGAAAAAAWDPAGEGHPAIVGRLNGYPLEVRIWHRRPAGVSDAVRHPSGSWVAIRVL